jgi:cation diffusion facilitator CzcD-associated flavoprotein CzcO
MHADVAVIGAGISGLCAAMMLKTAGLDSFVVFEKAPAVGGVWRANTYPGAGCDLPSRLYSYSFEPSDWSGTYSGQPEILDYLKRCAKKHDLRSHLRFDIEITRITYRGTPRLWELTAADGSQHTARVVITATGQLDSPRVPQIPGIEDFSGTTFHSARWEHGHPMTGRTVAVVGNGCSAVQLVPQIARNAKQVSVFQRSPKWVIPKFHRDYRPLTRRLFTHFRAARKIHRAIWFASAETIAYSPIHGGLWGKALTLLARYHLRRQVRDRKLREKLSPKYAFGCNRMILSNDYYPALSRDNVDLVTDNILRIVPHGIATTDGTVHQADTIIFATGFHATRFLNTMEVIGPHGNLHDQWENGASAHLGITVPGFPNLFMLYGPNTSSASNSIIYMIESQMRYIVRCLSLLPPGGSIEVTQHAYNQYQQDLEKRLRTTVWQQNCRSWYKTKAGRVTNMWPGRAHVYRRATRLPQEEDFHLHE